MRNSYDQRLQFLWSVKKIALSKGFHEQLSNRMITGSHGSD
jgi:hypothetical protein